MISPYGLCGYKATFEEEGKTKKEEEKEKGPIRKPVQKPGAREMLLAARIEPAAANITGIGR